MKDTAISYRCGECIHYMEKMDEEKKHILNAFKLYKCDEFLKLCKENTPTYECYKFKPKNEKNLGMAA